MNIPYPFPVPKVKIAGVELDSLSFAQVLAQIEEHLKTNQKTLLVTPNPEMVLAASRDPAFRAILNSAALAVPDGIGLIWASYFLSLPQRNLFTLAGSLLALLFRASKVFRVLPERVTGTDLFPEILKIAAMQNKKVFLLGAVPGVAEAAAQQFKIQNSKFKNLVVETFAGSPRVQDEQLIRTKIQKSGAELLFVAFGAPAQEQWLARNLLKLQNIKFAAGVGGAFDFHAGIIRRAPKVLRTLGLEWLWRLIRQPSRWPRIWNATFRFIRLVWRLR